MSIVFGRRYDREYKEDADAVVRVYPNSGINRWTVFNANYYEIRFSEGERSFLSPLPPEFHLLRMAERSRPNHRRGKLASVSSFDWDCVEKGNRTRSSLPISTPSASNRN